MGVSVYWFCYCYSRAFAENSAIKQLLSNFTVQHVFPSVIIASKAGTTNTELSQISSCFGKRTRRTYKGHLYGKLWTLLFPAGHWEAFFILFLSPPPFSQRLSLIGAYISLSTSPSLSLTLPSGSFLFFNFSYFHH